MLLSLTLWFVCNMSKLKEVHQRVLSRRGSSVRGKVIYLSFTISILHSSLHLFIPPSPHPSLHPPIHSSTPPFTHPPTHLFTHVSAPVHTQRHTYPALLPTHPDISVFYNTLPAGEIHWTFNVSERINKLFLAAQIELKRLGAPTAFSRLPPEFSTLLGWKECLEAQDVPESPHWALLSFVPADLLWLIYCSAPSLFESYLSFYSTQMLDCIGHFKALWDPWCVTVACWHGLPFAAIPWDCWWSQGSHRECQQSLLHF